MTDSRLQVAEYLDKKLCWVMIWCPDEAAYPFAAEVFRKLTRSKIPAWAPQFSGAHGSLHDALLHGLQNAAVFCQILSPGSTKRAQTELEYQAAVNDGVDVLTIVTDAKLRPSGIASKNPTFKMWSDMPAAKKSPVFDALIAEVTKPGRAHVLAHAISGEGHRRERRLSDSESKNEATIHNSPTGKRLVKKVSLSPNGPEGSLEWRLRTQCLFPEQTVQKYLTIFRGEFQTNYSTDDETTIFQYDDIDLLLSLDLPLVHAKAIKKQIAAMREAENAMHMPPAKSAAGLPKVILDWPVEVRRHLFKENAVDVMNKLHRQSCLASLLTVEKRFIDSNSPKHIFVSHCTKDEGMKIYEKLDTFFSTREHTVFNPSEEFQKRTASSESMEASVMNAQVCLVALSPLFFESKWCLKEVAAAKKAGIRVVPCYAGDYCANSQVDAWVAGNIS